MYTYEHYNFRVICLVLVIMAIFFFGEGMWPGGVISVLLIFATVNSHTGVHIDPENGRYRKYDRFWGLKIGKWEKLPQPSYVGLVRINLSSVRSAASTIVVPQGKKAARAYKINLAVEGPKRYISICKGNLDKMTLEALRLGEHLDLKVMDMSTADKKWIR